MRRLFHELWSNDDTDKNQLVAQVIKGEHLWLEAGTFGLGSSSPLKKVFRPPWPFQSRHAGSLSAGIQGRGGEWIPA